MSTPLTIAKPSQFKWTRFFEEFADRLLRYKDNREILVAEIHEIAARRPDLIKSGLQDRFDKGRRGPLEDICPFTTIGLFNRHRGTSYEKRVAIAQELAQFLGVGVPAPDSFEGIPVVDARGAWFFAFAKDREAHAIDSLWNVFESALLFSKKTDDLGVRTQFASAYDRAMKIKYVAWNLTMGLFWVRPRTFQTCDSHSRDYISQVLGIAVEDIVKENAQEYLALLDSLSAKFQEESSPVRSYQELSYRADSPDNADDLENSTLPASEDGTAEVKVLYPKVEFVSPIKQFDAYSVEEVLGDGSFIEKARLEDILQRLRDKKNLILQGSPGTGKTWLARRLAYALVGEKDDSKVRAVQFHPNLSYEDFVRGWRPSGDGQLGLVDGPFMEMIDSAKKDPEANYVIVVEEINRGNPAQIFGEMLTLLEADKREPGEALALTYRKDAEERVYIPENLHLIGTMNLADRSLAMVDFALRRRFAFVTLEPVLGAPWSDWVQTNCNVDPEVLLMIGNKLNALNRTLSDDVNLGPHFQVGHSFVTPSANSRISDSQEWFRHVVETEIGPLLDEYWFDARETAQTERDRLLEGF